jgi:DNA invertase Pin-like site-specific DNA recombinase
MRCRPRGAGGYTTTPAAAQLPSGRASPRRSTTCGRATPWLSWKLDRIGRSLGHVVELVGGLQAKGIGLKVLTGGIDTTSSTGRLVFGIFATLAEFERDLIRERTIAGLAAARARGRNGGRPRLMTRAKLRTAMAMMADRGNVAGDIAEQLGISLSTLYAYVDGEGRPKLRATKLLGR